MRRVLIVILFLTTACSSLPQRTAESAVSDRIFCGLTTPTGEAIAEADWRAFVRDEVTPRFPDGFTLWLAEGSWRGRDGEVIREPVLIIEIIHRYNVRAEEDVFAIAQAYKTRFKQEAVLRLTTPARMELID